MINRLKKYTEILDKKFYNFDLEIKDYYGVNKGIVNKIIKLFGFSKKGEITEPLKKDVNILESFLRKDFMIGDEFKKEIESRFNRYLIIKSYRGFRHKFKLPANGQRTRVNARTSRKHINLNLGNQFNKDIYNLKNYVLEHTTEKESDD